MAPRPSSPFATSGCALRVATIIPSRARGLRHRICAGRTPSIHAPILSHWQRRAPTRGAVSLPTTVMHGQLWRTRHHHPLVSDRRMATRRPSPPFLLVPLHAHALLPVSHIELPCRSRHLGSPHRPLNTTIRPSRPSSTADKPPRSPAQPMPHRATYLAELRPSCSTGELPHQNPHSTPSGRTSAAVHHLDAPQASPHDRPPFCAACPRVGGRTSLPQPTSPAGPSPLLRSTPPTTTTSPSRTPPPHPFPDATERRQPPTTVDARPSVAPRRTSRRCLPPPRPATRRCRAPHRRPRRRFHSVIILIAPVTPHLPCRRTTTTSGDPATPSSRRPFTRHRHIPAPPRARLRPHTLTPPLSAPSNRHDRPSISAAPLPSTAGPLQVNHPTRDIAHIRLHPSATNPVASMIHRRGQPIHTPSPRTHSRRVATSPLTPSRPVHFALSPVPHLARCHIMMLLWCCDGMVVVGCFGVVMLDAVWR